MDMRQLFIGGILLICIGNTEEQKRVIIILNKCFSMYGPFTYTKGMIFPQPAV